MTDIFISLDFLVRELSFFAAFWLLLGAIDDAAIDVLYYRLVGARRKISDMVYNQYVAPAHNDAASAHDRVRPHYPAKRYALFIPVWQESAVIGQTLRTIAQQWPDADLRIYVGCYPNDDATIRAVMHSGHDPRLRIVINTETGPTTKARCLNRLWQALRADEHARGQPYDAIILHDAEDVVHPNAMAVFAHYLQDHDIVQLPVLPMVYPGSPMISGHYCDEFAEAHGKFMPVRLALGASMPLAGVGCAIKRDSLALLVAQQVSGLYGPFSEQSLTEDYELGVRLHMAGASSHFATLYDETRQLVATRAYFPHELGAAVRQKSRWTAGIALSGWDRLGWHASGAHIDDRRSNGDGKWLRRGCEFWMLLRDRRAMLGALVLLAAYMAMLGGLIIGAAHAYGWYDAAPYSAPFLLLLSVNALFLLWRLAMRCIFTYRHYGTYQALLAVPRMFIANIISIMAARRAVISYCRVLIGQPVIWDKTAHIFPHQDAVAPGSAAAVYAHDGQNR